MKLGDTFTDFDITTSDGIAIHGEQGGSGPPLLLIHGFPQTHLIWHKIAPALSSTCTVIAPDLRGYGASSCVPESALDRMSNHRAYAKSTMALDMVDVMKQLGYDEFYVCGHDRGARVTHKLCVDHPKAVKKAMLLDICPTLAMYEATDFTFAQTYWHWFFLTQPAPFPEDVILGNVDAYADKSLGGALAGNVEAVFHPEARASYVKQLGERERIHALCEDYRAAASVDMEEQRADIKEGRKIRCPLKVLWGKKGLVGKKFDALGEWRKVSDADVSGEAIDCGHYIPEERPDELLAQITDFFSP